MTEIRIGIGGEGEVETLTVEIFGCSCRTEDFLLALVGFAKNWKGQADAADWGKQFASTEPVEETAAVDENGNPVINVPCKGCGKKKKK